MRWTGTDLRGKSKIVCIVVVLGRVAGIHGEKHCLISLLQAGVSRRRCELAEAVVLATVPVVQREGLTMLQEVRMSQTKDVV